MTKSFTLAELAHITESKLIGDPNKRVTSFADLHSAGVDDVSFLRNSNADKAMRDYEKTMRASKAGVVFVASNIALDDGKNYLINEDPSRAYQLVIETFMGDTLSCPTGFEGIHSTAVIHASATLGDGAMVGPYAVIDAGVKIGKKAFIGAHAYIGKDVTIGDDVYIYSGAIVRERCQIGNRVVLQPGAIIGSCGFGYTTSAKGEHTKLAQVGIVTLEDDVEIGAGTTIDRSRFQATVIGKGTKIDNLVQIGHGVTIGRHSIVVAQTGIAGSTKVGNHVVIAGQVAIAGHINIADGVTISARTGVSKSLEERGGKYGGVPAQPMSKHNRQAVLLRNIERYVQEINELKTRLSTLEDQL